MASGKPLQAPDTRDDATLLAEIADCRNHDAFTALFHRYDREAYNLARYITDSSDLAETTVQMAMVRVWLYARSFKSGEVRKWIMTIVAREAVKQIKARRKSAAAELREDMHEPAQHSLRSYEQEETAQALKGAIEQLPSNERQVVTLYYTTEMQLEEIGQALQLSRQLVSYRLKKALEKMRGFLVKAGFAGAIPLLESGEWLPGVLQSGAAAPVGLHEGCLQLIHNPPAELLRQSFRSSRKAANPAGAGTMTAVVTLVVVSVAAGCACFMSQSPGPSPQAAPAPMVAPAPKLLVTPEPAGAPVPAVMQSSRKWVFNQPNNLDDLITIKGNWHFVAGDRITPPHMLTDEGETLIWMNINVPRAPVKLRIRTSAVGPARAAGHVATCEWLFHTLQAEIKNVLPMKAVAMGQWVDKIDYLSESFKFDFADDQPVGFAFMERFQDAPPLLVLVGKQRVSEIEIMTIAASTIPEARPYSEYLQRIPPEKRVGRVLIPELKSLRPPMPVYVEFVTPRIPEDWPPQPGKPFRVKTPDGEAIDLKPPPARSPE